MEEKNRKGEKIVERQKPEDPCVDRETNGDEKKEADGDTRARRDTCAFVGEKRIGGVSVKGASTTKVKHGR